MTKENPLASYPVNPRYGTGSFHRRILLTSHQGYVEGKLEDCNHGFTVKVFHNDQQVTGFDAEFKRTPFSTCSGARRALDNLIDAPLNLSNRELNQWGNPSANCTHLLDLAILCIQHQQKAEAISQFDVIVHDEVDAVSDMKVYYNERCIHHWQGSLFAIVAPLELKGNPLLKGFAGWANETFEGLKNEAAFALQKGYFVAQARRYDVDALAGESAADHQSMIGACHTYSADVAPKATRNANNARDFNGQEELLLKFV